MKDILEKLKKEAWFQRIDDKFGEDLQGDCIDFIEKVIFGINGYRTQLEHCEKALEHLKNAIDIFPDKDDTIREYNNKLDKIISQLEEIIK